MRITQTADYLEVEFSENANKKYIAKILDLDLKFDFKREFLKEDKINTQINAIYEINQHRRNKDYNDREYYQIVNNEVKYCTKGAIIDLFNLKHKRQFKLDALKYEVDYSKKKYNLLNKLHKLILQFNCNYKFVKSLKLYKNEEIDELILLILNRDDNFFETILYFFRDKFLLKFEEIYIKLQKENQKEKIKTK